MRRILQGVILAALVVCLAPQHAIANCTIGVANGIVTEDSRPVLWKSRMAYDPLGNHVFYAEGPVYDFIGIKGLDNTEVRMGVNEAGLATGNALLGGSGNSAFMEYVLGHFATVAEVRAYLLDNYPNMTHSSCFPFIDATGEATMFETFPHSRPYEYNCLDRDRIPQGLYGWVVRDNTAHENADGTDDIWLGGRYETARVNTNGLIELGVLSALTVMQGNDGANDFEFMRYGPGRPLATIAVDSACASMGVLGVAEHEDARLTTMWSALGQANFAIAVPTWIVVRDIPQCLNDGSMAGLANGLRAVNNEELTQASVFPVEAHMYSEVQELMNRWRPSFELAQRDMPRVEQRMATDAYSLLYCLLYTQNNNLAPSVQIRITGDSPAFVTFLGDRMSIDNLAVYSPPVRVYDDDFSTNKAERDSYDHSIFWPEMAIPPAEPYLFYTRVVQPPEALAFMQYHGQYAYLRYKFFVTNTGVQAPYFALTVNDLGHGYAAYSLSPDGQMWTFPSPLQFGENRVRLVAGEPTLTRCFHVDASDPDGDIESIEWDFGDGHTGQGWDVCHTYRRPGVYLVSCTVTDDDGVSITDWLYLSVFLPNGLE